MHSRTAWRKELLDRLFKAADQRGVRLFLPLGLMTWGYDEIIAKDLAVRRQDGVANPCPSAMCGAQEKSWSYIEKIIDTAMQQYPFAGIHMESADQGYCMCPLCSGADGVVGYNARLNARCADYVRAKYPGTITMTIPINWLPGAMAAVGVTPKFTSEEMAHVLELSKHIDIFMDQGHCWTFTPADQITQLHCAYGTSRSEFTPNHFCKRRCQNRTKGIPMFNDRLSYLCKPLGLHALFAPTRKVIL